MTPARTRLPQWLAALIVALSLAACGGGGGGVPATAGADADRRPPHEPGRHRCGRRRAQRRADDRRPRRQRQGDQLALRHGLGVPARHPGLPGHRPRAGGHRLHRTAAHGRQPPRRSRCPAVTTLTGAKPGAVRALRQRLHLGRGAARRHPAGEPGRGQRADPGDRRRRHSGARLPSAPAPAAASIRPVPPRASWASACSCRTAGRLAS